MYKKNIVVLSLVLFGFNSLFATPVSKEGILDNSYFIQIAILKNRSNVENVKKQLSNYDLFIEPYKSMNRIFVVNIDNKSKLQEIQKIYPSAFIAKRPKIVKISKPVSLNMRKKVDQEIGVFKVLDNNLEPEIINEVIEVEETVLEQPSKRKETILLEPVEETLDLDTILNEEPKNIDLDSNTILKTRKSFL